MATGEHAEAGFKRPNWKAWLGLSVVVLLIAAAVLPPLININRYQRKITDSVSRSLGRPVHMSEVKLRLLPRPGFEIANFVVDEDPAFGVEPTLRSASVVASLRLWSLWRGRLEVARISLDEPSLNLVRNRENRWNVGTVLVQASRLSNAPTGQRHPGGAPRFPYIEASGARINFKFGNEKKPFSFLNADVSMWLANPEEWELRFLGQPARTDLDLDLSDTGELRVNGTLRRAAKLGQMPVRLRAEWSQAPLGQMSRLLLGQDSGWRGDLDVTAEVSGNLQDMAVKTRMRVDGVHRVEFTPMATLNLDTHCEGMFHRASHSLDGVACLSQVGDGQVVLRGGIADLNTPLAEATLELTKVPAALALDGLRLVRNGFAPGVQVSGLVDGNFSYHADPKLWPLEGQATVTGLAVAAPGFEKVLIFPAVHVVTTRPEPVTAKAHGRIKAVAAPVATLAQSRMGLVLQPFPLGMGGATPLTVGGSFDSSGFQIRLVGGTALSRLIAAGKDFGLLASPAARLKTRGTADLDLTMHGPWVLPVLSEDHPLSATATEGTVRLHDAQVDPGFLVEPLEIAQAQANLTATSVTWSPVAVSFHDIPIEGSLSYDVPCGSGETPCVRHFDVSVATLDAGALEAALLGAGEHGELMNEILAKVNRQTPQWPDLMGTIHTGTLTLGVLALHDATAVLRVGGNKLTIESLDGRALGGGLHASGGLEAIAAKPHYILDATLTRANPAEAGELFHEAWGAGAVNAATHLDLQGFTGDDLRSSAHGTFHWDWTKGSLPVAGLPLARFDRWVASGTVGDETLTLDKSTLTRGSQGVPLTGTVTFDREYALKSGSKATLSGSLHAGKVQGTTARK